MLKNIHNSYQHDTLRFLKDMNLKGNIKAIELNHYYAVVELDGGKLAESQLIDLNGDAYSYTFDKMTGLVTEVNWGDKLTSYKRNFKFKNATEIMLRNIIKGDKQNDNFFSNYKIDNSFVSFDTGGRIIEVDKVKQFRYDNDGRLASAEIEFVNSFLATSKAFCRYRYDSSGKIIEENLCDGQGMLMKKWIHKYDELGNRSELIELDANDYMISKKWNYVFDDQGRLTKSFEFETHREYCDVEYPDEVYDSEENAGTQEFVLHFKIKYLNIYSYLVGNKIEFKRYDANRKMVVKSVTSYNDKMVILEEITESEDYDDLDLAVLNYDGLLDSSITKSYNKTCYKYNEEGFLAEKRLYKNRDILHFIHEWQYDDLGNVIKWIRSSPEQEKIDVISYKYVYDNNNNWIQRIEFVGEEPRFIIERTLRYFE